MNNQTKTQTVHSNHNYKVLLRMKPMSEEDREMIEVNDNAVTVKDTTNKNSNDHQTFGFNTILKENHTQKDLFKIIAENAITKIIEGHNACVLSYGQTHSGKSYTIFGEDERYTVDRDTSQLKGEEHQGLVPRTIDYLFKKAKDLEEIREFVITCSFIEIFLDQVRDLGKAYLEALGEGISPTGKNTGIQQSDFLTENLEIYENTNGQIMIKNLALVPVVCVEDLYDILHEGIFTINLVQKDKENENLPFMNATIQFVDLAGSERIAKSLTEGYKFQETIIINSSLTTLGKCLLAIAQSSGKNIPYRDSKLTRAIQNCLSSICHIFLIVNVHPRKASFEECLSTFQYAEKTRSIEVKGKITGLGEEQLGVMNVGHFPGSEKMVKKLNDELNEAKSRIEFLQKEQRQKMQELQKILGFEGELEKLLSKQVTENRDKKNFDQQRDALGKLEDEKAKKKESEQKIENLMKKKEAIKREEFSNIEKNIATMLELKETGRRQHEELKIHELNINDQKANIVKEKDVDKRQIESHNDLMLTEKAELVGHLPLEQISKKSLSLLTPSQKELKRKSLAINNDLKPDLRKVIDAKDFKKEQSDFKGEFQRLHDNMKKQYEYFLELRNGDIDEYVKKMADFQQKKKNQILQYRAEILDVYDVIQKQNKIIEKIEHGQYSAGIRSFKLPPSEEKPDMPSRLKHKKLFGLLDEKHAQNREEFLKKSADFIKLTSTFNDSIPKNLTVSNVVGNKMNTTGNASSVMATRQLAKITPPISRMDSLSSLEKIDDESKLPEKVDINSIDLEADIKKMLIDKLKPYANSIKIALKMTIAKEEELRDKITNYEKKYQNIDINLLLKEREYYKKLYEEELKKSRQISLIHQQKKREQDQAKIQKTLMGSTISTNFYNTTHNNPEEETLERTSKY